VNQNFQSIFAILSEGDVTNLMTPKTPSTAVSTWLPPQRQTRARLTSMSGGEKSLTAQLYLCPATLPPLPFYAFDEVDMFLDGQM